MIKEILENNLIDIYLQPIVSIRTKRIYAFEALTRCTYEEFFIPPNRLFELAQLEELCFELDTFTREKSIEKFYPYYQENKDLILFLNIESSLINNFDKRKDYCCIKTINKLGIPYKNFMIEIKEDEITNTIALEEFCSCYKKLGFSIALDDFGTGNSTFDRINIIKPHLIKIDKSLFVNIKNNLIHKEIVKAIAKMSHNLGIRVLAEGVEDEDAICNAMESNINLFQGYYFARPDKTLSLDKMDLILTKINKIGNLFKQNTINLINQKRDLINFFTNFSNQIIKEINDVYKSKDILSNILNNSKELEAIYLIDAKTSKQINDTFINPDNIKVGFKATKDGDEHYLKEYYFITLESKQENYLSETYVSFATGNICKTFARKFELDFKHYILCLDLIVQQE